MATLSDFLLIGAIRKNDISHVASLIRDGSADVNCCVGVRDVPLLCLAAKLGHVEIVALLLEAGARIDDVDYFHESACHAAVHGGHIGVVELLIAHHADISLRNEYNGTPISISIIKKNERLLMLLIDAATNVIQLLVHKHRIDFSAIRDSGGCTPLHRAVEGAGFNVPKVVSMLIEVAGVDVDARDQDGYTAAHVACTMRDADALTCLVAAGANLELANNIGNTPLLIFQFSTTVRIVTTLLAGGANVLARNTSGSTACHLACQMSHVSLPALLAFGANLDEPADNNGATPRQLLKTAPPTTEDIALARQSVHSVQLSLVRKRAFEICVALRSLDLDALCMCEILPHSCGPVAPFVPFYIWWQFVTKIKHWQMATQ